MALLGWTKQAIKTYREVISKQAGFFDKMVKLDDYAFTMVMYQVAFYIMTNQQNYDLDLPADTIIHFVYTQL